MGSKIWSHTPNPLEMTLLLGVVNYLLRDPPPKYFLSPKSHILDSNGVWYSSFWSEGPGQGPRGTAPNDKSLKSFISGAAPRNPMALCLETPGAPRLKTPGDKF